MPCSCGNVAVVGGCGRLWGVVGVVGFVVSVFAIELFANKNT